MANFISHSILADKTNIMNLDVNFLRLYSIGQDLTFTRQSCFDKSHNINTLKFFKKLLDLIKEFNCEKNEVVLAFLYGHISHFTFDTTIHPYINSITSRNPFNHNIIECQMDIFLINNFSDKDLDKALEVNMDDLKILEIIINRLYSETYMEKNIYHFYKKTINLIKKVNYFLKKIYRNKNLKKNIDEESFNKIYNISVEKTIKRINDINDLLKGDIDIDKLEEIIPDISYNSGEKCNVLKK